MTGILIDPDGPIPCPVVGHCPDLLLGANDARS